MAEYEVLEKPFGSKRGNPRDIYYIPNPDMINTWLTGTENDEKQKLRRMGNHLAVSAYLDYHSDDNDNKDDDNQGDN